MRLSTFYIAFVLACCLLIVTTSSGDMMSNVNVVSERALVEKGKQVTDTIIKLIRSDEFHKLLDVIGVAGGPIAGSITSILKVIIGKNSGDDAANPDMEFMKNAFAEINSKLEAFTHEFKEIKDMIDWSAVQVSFGSYERSIRALKSQLAMLVNAPAAAIPDMKNVYILKYESDYNNAAEKLYDAMVNTDLIFASNLLEASAKFTSNYRSKVQRFGMGLLQLLLQAVEVQLAYYDLKYNNDMTSDYIKKVWDERFATLETRMRHFDEVVQNRWVTQMKTDSIKLLQDNKQLTHNEFVVKWYQFLDNKYPWRYWATSSFEAVTGSEKFAQMYCSGFVSLGTYGRNAFAASVDRNQSHFHQSKPKELVNSVKFTDKSALDILKKINEAEGPESERCQTYALKLVVEKSYKLNSGALSPQAYDREICVSTFWGTTCYTAFFFG